MAGLARIRELNDRLRTTGRGGMVVITNGVGALGWNSRRHLHGCVAFTGFNPDNDPWGEHDCAALTVDGHRVIWKIDYYDRSRRSTLPTPPIPRSR